MSYISFALSVCSSFVIRLDFLPSENYPSDLFAVFCIRRENLNSVFQANNRVWQRKPREKRYLSVENFFTETQGSNTDGWRQSPKVLFSLVAYEKADHRKIARVCFRFPVSTCLHNIGYTTSSGKVGSPQHPTVCIPSHRNRTRFRIFSMVLPLEILQT